MLLLVARADPPDVLLERGENADLLPDGVVPPEGGLGEGVLEDEVFVGVQTPRAGRGDALARGVEGVDPHLVDRGLPVALVELLDVHAVALVVLGPQAQGVRLDPQVRVLGHDHHGGVPVPHLFAERHREDLVVLPVSLELGRQEVRPFAVEGDAEHPAAVEGHPFRKAPLAPQPVDELRHRPGVAPEHVQVLLEAVEFLDHGDGDDDPVVAEFEKGGGIVQQDVGVQHEVFDHPSSGKLAGPII